VSVVIPYFNAGTWFDECLHSCFAATSRSIEVIVVDDGSSDDPALIVNRLPAAERGQVRCIRQPNTGAAAARARGQEEVRGDWVAFIDADDCFKPGSLDVLIASASGVDAVYGDVELVDGNRHAVGRRDQSPPVAHPIAAMFFRAPLNGSSVIRRDAAGPFWTRHRRAAEFFYFCLAAIDGVRFRHLPVVVCEYRQHEGPDRLTNHAVDYPSLLADAFLELEQHAASRGKLDESLAAYLHWIRLDLSTQVVGEATRASLLQRASMRGAVPFGQWPFALRWYGLKQVGRMLHRAATAGV
jgi:glycosyltransferase involved in cell wall biosynthesis